MTTSTLIQHSKQTLYLLEARQDKNKQPYIILHSSGSAGFFVTIGLFLWLGSNLLLVLSASQFISVFFN
ncbi:unnamed protein product [Trifolium pratense]|uniref:Uncharacterized protein n=1 Tax=Trifolium pratense TaxID=57577 RepID=A0ACB0LM30_TRIPR|nr:unnamed protein product [Trifolium pratense]